MKDNHYYNLQEDYRKLNDKYNALKDKPVTEHPDVQKLIAKMVVLQGKYDALKASQEKLITSRAKYAFLLGRYGRHDNSCPMSGKFIDGKRCFCGYTENIKALKEAGEL